MGQSEQEREWTRAGLRYRAINEALDAWFAEVDAARAAGEAAARAARDNPALRRGLVSATGAVFDYVPEQEPRQERTRARARSREGEGEGARFPVPGGQAPPVAARQSSPPAPVVKQGRETGL